MGCAVTFSACIKVKWNNYNDICITNSSVEKEKVEALIRFSKQEINRRALKVLSMISACKESLSNRKHWTDIELRKNSTYLPLKPSRFLISGFSSYSIIIVDGSCFSSVCRPCIKFFAYWRIIFCILSVWKVS